MKKSAKPRRRGSDVTGAASLRVVLSPRLTRDDLIAAHHELRKESPSWKARVFALSALTSLIDAMPPKRDRRVNVTVWQLAMIAKALVKKERAKAEVAVRTAIEVFAPSLKNDSKFRETVSRTYRKLGQGVNPARGLLLRVNKEILFIATSKLPKNGGNISQ